MENLSKALVGVHLLHWIVTYPVDKVIRPLNNWGQVNNYHDNLQVLSVKPGLVLIGLPTTLSCSVDEQSETEEHLNTTWLIVFSCSAYFFFFYNTSWSPILSHKKSPVQPFEKSNE